MIQVVSVHFADCKISLFEIKAMFVLNNELKRKI